MTSRFEAGHSAPPSSLDRKSVPSLDAALLGLLQASSLACIVLDSSQNIQGWNGSMEALLGWTASEAQDRSFSSFMAGGKGYAKLDLADSLSRPHHYRLQSKNKEVLEVKIQGVPLPAGLVGEAAYVLLLQDETERKFLEKALLHAAEREQRRIGQELHDHLCQHLLGAAFAAKALAGDLDRECSPQAPQLHDLARLINDAVIHVRDLSRGLHPVELDSEGLMSALQELANRAGQSTPCDFRCEQHVLVKSAQVALNAYRIAQETITAALQDTEAEKIEMSLSQSHNRIRLDIFDDGKKESELTANPLGIEAKTMQYRAQAMKATLSMDFNSREGTRVTCLFPA